MLDSSAAKGKARAVVPIDSSQVSHASLPRNAAHNHASHAADRLVRPQPIPSTTLLNVEYPGILSEEPVVEHTSASGSYTSLERALSTLHPSTLPPLTSSPLEALHYLSRIPNEGLKVVECRLGGFASPPPQPDLRQQSGTTNSSAEQRDIDQLYRAPLLGEAVPTHNIVIRVVKRTWRQKKRKRQSADSPKRERERNDPTGSIPQHDLALDPALLAEAHAGPEDRHSTDQSHDTNPEPSNKERFTGRIKKEYRVQVLGMATNTVRFRSLADFAFQPDVTTSSSSRPNATTQLDPVMALHKALATMDLEAFQNFRIPEQLEDYEVRDPSAGPDAPPKSNLHMVPPAFFSRMDVPFNYGFQQTPYSELRTIPTPAHLTIPPTGASFAHALKRSDLVPGQMQRFVNRVRLSNIAPQPFRVGRDTKVPIKPLPDVVRIEHRCEPKVLARLRELLIERPVWSRVALKNQLTEEELRELQGNNEKVYYALVGYSMVGGPWRDTIVRFGYDVRKDNSSRIYQRIFLRGGPMNRESRISVQGAQLRQAGDEGDDESDQAEEALAAARSSVVPLPTAGVAAGEGATERTRNTHTFDGVSLHRNVGNFQLCDINDPLIKPFIWRTNDDHLPEHSVLELEPMRTEWLSKTYDPETGWYTRRALELIRALVTARFKSLADTHKPLDPEAVHAIVQKTRHKWLEEDTAPHETKAKPRTPEQEPENQDHPPQPRPLDEEITHLPIDPALT